MEDGCPPDTKGGLRSFAATEATVPRAGLILTPVRRNLTTVSVRSTAVRLSLSRVSALLSQEDQAHSWTELAEYAASSAMLRVRSCLTLDRQAVYWSL